MKKLTALLLLVAIIATSVFATPFAGSFAFEFDEEASVTELSELEAVEVEGEGIIAAVTAGLIGIPVGGFLSAVTIAVKPSRHTASSAADTILQGMVTGCVGGFLAALLTPTP
ncbi:MAG: hypothetical protein ACTTJZ_06480 [Sphaerochaetaceae bacterium]